MGELYRMQADDAKLWIRKKNINAPMDGLVTTSSKREMNQMLMGNRSMVVALLLCARKVQRAAAWPMRGSIAVAYHAVSSFKLRGPASSCPRQRAWIFSTP